MRIGTVAELGHYRPSPSLSAQLAGSAWPFASPEQFVSFFRRWYGPVLKAFEALDSDGRAALTADLSQLARHWNRNHGRGIAIPAT